MMSSTGEPLHALSDLYSDQESKRTKGSMCVPCKFVFHLKGKQRESKTY